MAATQLAYTLGFLDSFIKRESAPAAPHSTPPAR
jgi:hypothetical protein